MKKSMYNVSNLLLQKKQVFLIMTVILSIFGSMVQAQTGATKICSASDLHYFSPSLLINDGTAFQSYLASDRKMIAESKAITSALVKKIKEEKPAIFIVTGDLTKDGEKISHQEMAKYLDSIEMNGVTKVYVVPGNHDVNNYEAFSYDGATKSSVEKISASDFSTIYSNFGYGEADQTDSISLTYLAKPSSNLWILGIDVCMYDSNKVGTTVTAGRFKANTWKWILDRLAEAKNAGAQVIGLMHHGITEHYTGQSVSYSDYVVKGWDTASVKLADAGLNLMFTGHYHANDITKKAGTGSNFIYDIETGSTVTAPCPYRVMYLNSNNYLNINTRYITEIDYNLGGKTFTNYAKDFLTTGMNGMVKYSLMNPPYSLDEGTADFMTPHVVSAYVAHYAGDEKISASEQAFITGISSTGLAGFAPMLTALWTDLNPSDNNVTLNLSNGTAQTKQTVDMIYTSDAHYGITRTFRSVSSTTAQTVNAAMIAKINAMPGLSYPSDAGVNAGNAVSTFDYLIETGDIANRQQAPVQNASASWAQFKTDYIDSLKITDVSGTKTALLLSPGNHDVSNAIGYYSGMVPAKDSAAMVNIYNMMMPTALPTVGNYNYATSKVHYSKNIGGVHFMFVNMWPDSSERVWMTQDLQSVKLTTPVVIFTHDQPSVESKHFTNPNSPYTINSTNKFENLLSETFKDGKTTSSPSTIEQAGFTSYLRTHRNIVAYFHGNDNANEYYTYRGTDSTVALSTFRIDSPMKGNISGSDETKLSFQTISIDTVTKQMTVRECLWNAGASASTPVAFGAVKTMDLGVSTNLVAFANALVDTNYTVPSWTVLKKALAANTGDSASIATLTSAVNNLVVRTKPYNVVATFNGSPKTQMGFAWFTNKNVTGGQVQIVAGTATDASAFASPAYTLSATTETVTLNYNVSANALPTASIPVNSQRSYVSNKALATGLTAGTTYSYRVGKAGSWSDIGTFTTAPESKDAFSFIYYTDPQAMNDSYFDVSQKTTHAALSMNPSANFVLNCGDLVETSNTNNSEWEYEQYFQTQQDIWLKKPLAPTEGNHDISTNKNWTKHFNTANPSFDKNMSTVPGSVYSFVYGDALFMALSYENYSTTGYLDSLAVWMNAQVKANPTVKWRIAFYHKTMYTGSSSHQSDADGKTVREKMGPVFDSLKIDWALQGHDHIYEVIGPVKAKALVANEVSDQQTVSTTVRDNLTGKLGGTFDVNEGTLYFLNNSAGKKKYEPRTQAQMTAVEAGLGLSNYFGMFSGRFGQTGEPTFSNITVSTDSIKVSTYTVNDAGVATLFDEYKIVKQAAVKTVWDGSSWNPSAPLAKDTAVINGNYVGKGFNCVNLTINAGKQVSLTSGKLAISGDLRLKNNSTNGAASFIDNATVTVGGNTYVEQFIKGGRNWYMSSPVSSAKSSVVKTPLTNGLWSYNETTNNWDEILDATSSLTVMNGYVANVAADTTLTFTGGVLNTGNKSITVSSSNGITKQGFNLIGNPYPSSINWKLASVDNLDATIWHRTKNKVNSYVFDTYNATDDLGTNNNGDAPVTKFIAPMQAFWVHVKTTTGQISLDNAVRCHQTGNKLKDGKTAEIVRIKVANGDNTDETIITFNKDANNGFDDHDSRKMFADNKVVPEIYTVADNEKLAINGLSSIDSNKVISLGFKTANEGTFTISANEISLSQNVPVILEDKMLKKSIDLTQTPSYTFTSNSCDNVNRFAIRLKSGSTETLSNVEESNINIYTNNGSLIIKTSIDNAKGNVTVIDVLGRVVVSGVLTGTTTTIDLPVVTGSYIVKVQTEKEVVSQSIVK